MNKKDYVMPVLFVMVLFGLTAAISYDSMNQSSTHVLLAPKLGEAEILIANGTWTAIYYKSNGYDMYQDSDYNSVVEWAMNQTRNQP